MPTMLARGLAASALAFALVALGPMRSADAADPPRVVASFLPVHALVAKVMGEVGRPYLLVPPGVSPHTFALRPSDAAALADAQLVVWVGPEMETFLAHSLDALAPQARRLGLLRDAGIATFPVREGGLWEPHEHEEHAEAKHEDDAHEHEAEEHGHEEIDPHIWLDPNNARAIVRAVAGALAAVDPERAETYRANATRTDRELASLDADIADRLADVAGRPFVVFHDAYAYFERRYGLRAVGSITLHVDQPPSAHRLLEIRDRIAATGAGCVFAEPQFSPKLVATVVDGTPARQGTLDPEGAGTQGPEAYVTLMRTLADALATCLESTD